MSSRRLGASSSGYDAVVRHLLADTHEYFSLEQLSLIGKSREGLITCHKDLERADI